MNLTISYLFSSSFIIQFTFSNPCDDMPENPGTFSNPCDDVPEKLGIFSNPCDDMPEKSGTFSNPCDDVPENLGTFSNPCDGASSAQPNSSSNHHAKLSAADIVAYPNGYISHCIFWTIHRHY